MEWSKGDGARAGGGPGPALAPSLSQDGAQVLSHPGLS